MATNWRGEQRQPRQFDISQDPVVDLRYLNEVAIPAHDPPADRGQFRAAAATLMADLADFDQVMHEVEKGKVAVYHENGGSHSNFCIATFGSDGFLSEARVPGHDFEFDEAGKVRE
jgi:hypothetical protein